MNALNEQAQKAICDIIQDGDDAIVKIAKRRVVVIRSKRTTAYKEDPPEDTEN